MTSAVTLKVSAKSNPNAVAGALAGALRERDSIELQAVAIARSYLKGAALDAFCKPSFVVVAIGDSERTAISLLVERCKLEEKVSQVED
jgi:stage V sporulation protein S